LFSGKINLSVVCSQLASRFQWLLQITVLPKGSKEMEITRLHTANDTSGYGVTDRRLWTTLPTVQSNAQGCPSLLTPYEVPSWPVVWNRHQHEASCCLLAATLDTSFSCVGAQTFMPQWDTYLNFVFYIACNRLIIFHLIQQLYSQQQTIRKNIGIK